MRKRTFIPVIHRTIASVLYKSIRHNVNLSCFTVFALVLFLSTFTIAKNVSKEVIAQNVDKVLQSARYSETNSEQRKTLSVDAPRFSKTRDGYLRHLGASPSQYFPVTSEVPGDAQSTARNFIAEHVAAFGISSPDVGFTVKKVKTKGRRSYVRLKQTYAGIPVFGAEVLVQLNADGGVEYVSNDIMTDTKSLDFGEILLVPSITDVEAEQIAVSVMAQEDQGLEFQAEPAILMIYEPSVVGNIGCARLVWHTKVLSIPDSITAELLLVDANSGEIALRYSLNQSIVQKNREIWYRYYDWTRWESEDKLVREERGSEYTRIPEVDMAFDYLGYAYNFYYNVHGRDSIDGAGLRMVVLVDSYFPYKAVWMGSHIQLKEEYVTDDVIAHELTHGVTQHESGLVYFNESGAINESFSDMWGEWIDQTYHRQGDPDDSEDVKWLQGEDCAEGALRNMKDPPEFDDPDQRGGDYWQNWLSDPVYDNGGVHINSGVNNKLCYLLTDGDDFNGHTVTGMGITRVAKLYYEVQTNLLTGAADYYDLYSALKQPAKNLDWSETEKQNLEQACQAVKINFPFNVEEKVYDSTDVPIEIGISEATVSELHIENAGIVVDLDVKLQITHTWNEDLDVFLIAPDGTRVKLFTDVGGHFDDFNDTMLDDEASLSILQGSAPFAGSYRPEGYLSSFDDISIMGTWSLEITDDFEQNDSGTLHTWSLIIVIDDSGDVE